MIFSLLSLHLVTCTHCKPSGKPLGLQACMHSVEVTKREKSLQLMREGRIQGEGGLYKNLKIPALPPKSTKSGVTFNFKVFRLLL